MFFRKRNGTKAARNPPSTENDTALVCAMGGVQREQGAVLTRQRIYINPIAQCFLSSTQQNTGWSTTTPTAEGSRNGNQTGALNSNQRGEHVFLPHFLSDIFISYICRVLALFSILSTCLWKQQRVSKSRSGTNAKLVMYVGSKCQYFFFMFIICKNRYAFQSTIQGQVFTLVFRAIRPHRQLTDVQKWA